MMDTIEFRAGKHYASINTWQIVSSWISSKILLMYLWSKETVADINFDAMSIDSRYSNFEINGSSYSNCPIRNL